MSDIALRVDRLGKRYRIGSAVQRNRTLKEAIAAAAGAPVRNFNRLRRLSSFGPGDDSDVVWALRDVSFEVQRGEVLGIIGRNGAGKSTLLKIMSRITDPTTGSGVVRGRVGSLLEVGTGFHPELTGRDNVYLNGAILGMDRGYIDRRFDEIVEFAGIGQFIDTPVKRYSSGMYLRLAFAVAVHLEPQILIVDEVLAVGDAEFQRRCIAKMDELARGSGRTVLFVSHSLPTIQRLCPRAILLDGGRLAADGPTAAVIGRYLARSGPEAPAGSWVDLSGAPRTGSGAARFTAVRYAGADPELAWQPHTGGPVEFALSIESDLPRDGVRLAVSIAHQSGTSLVNADTSVLERTISLRAGANAWRLAIERLHLKPGTYVVGLWLAARAGALLEQLDRIECAFRMEVTDPDRRAVRLDSRYDGVVACRFDVEEVADA